APPPPRPHGAHPPSSSQPRGFPLWAAGTHVNSVCRAACGWRRSDPMSAAHMAETPKSKAKAPAKAAAKAEAKAEAKPKAEAKAPAKAAPAAPAAPKKVKEAKPKEKPKGWGRVAKGGADNHCSVEGCKRAYRAKGWCYFHYKKWRQGELPHP